MSPLAHLRKEFKKAAVGPCRLPAPLSWQMLTRDRAAAVQRAILFEYLKTGRTTSRLLSLGIALLFWPWKSLAQAWKLTRREGRQVACICPRPAQFIQQLRLAWLHGISPQMYYQMGMAMSSSSIRPMEWLQNGHAALLSRVFRKEKTLPEINDKLLFAQIMRKHDVATPDTLAVFAGGKQVDSNTYVRFLLTLEQRNYLYAKPICSSGGCDQLLLQRECSGQWTCIASSYLSASFRQTMAQREAFGLNAKDVFSLLLSLSRVCPLIVQPRLVNHEGLPELGGRALLAVRLLTGRRDEDVMILRAVLRLPFKKQIASQHGVDSTVDVKTGCLGDVFEDSVKQTFSEKFLVDGPVIAGLELPLWEETLALVKKAHQSLSGYSFLGWDLAITPNGPVVLEANGNYGLSSLQKSGPRPLIDDDFLSVFECWTNKASP